MKFAPIIAVAALAVVASAHGSAGAAPPGCTMTVAAVDAALLTTAYKTSTRSGNSAGHHYRICEYVNRKAVKGGSGGELEVGVFFPFAGKLIGNLDEYCALAFEESLDEDQKACDLLRRSEEATDPDKKIKLLFAALSETGKARALEGLQGNPGFLAQPSRGFGSDVWVYLRNSASLLHTRCTWVYDLTNLMQRFDSCAEKAARYIVGLTLGKK
jgi:hypothetical protein